MLLLLSSSMISLDTRRRCNKTSYVNLADINREPGFVGPVLLARVQDEFLYLDMPVYGDPVWTTISPKVLGLCLRYGALNANHKFEIVNLFASGLVQRFCK